VAFGARSIAAAVVNPEGFITVIAVIAVIAAPTHGLSHALGNILQRPAVRGQHEMSELLSIGTNETAYDIGRFDQWLSHGCPPA